VKKIIVGQTAQNMFIMVFFSLYFLCVWTQYNAVWSNIEYCKQFYGYNTKTGLNLSGEIICSLFRYNQFPDCFSVFLKNLKNCLLLAFKKTPCKKYFYFRSFVMITLWSKDNDALEVHIQLYDIIILLIEFEKYVHPRTFHVLLLL